MQPFRQAQHCQRVVSRTQLTDAREKAVRHAFPNLEAHVDTGSAGAIGVASRVVEERLGVAEDDLYWRRTVVPLRHRPVRGHWCGVDRGAEDQEHWGRD